MSPRLSLLMGDGLKARSARSMLLTAINFGGGNALRLGGNLILTRLLFPEAFGLMALVQVVMAGLNMFSDLGFRASIIKDVRGEDPIYLDTAWTMQILRGLLLWGLTFAIAAPVAAFYEAPVLEQMLPVAGLVAVLQGFSSTKLATMNRALLLGRITVLTLGVQTAGLIATVSLALWLESVWALVLGGLVAPGLLAVLSHVVLPGHGNRIRFEYAAAANLIGFGSYIFIASVATFITMQADRAILGKLVSLDVLALYSIAFLLATVPQKLMGRLVDKVLFPLYAARPPGASKANFTQLGKARALIIVPSMAFAALLAVFGDTLVIWLYDPRYEAAGPLLVLIAVAQLPAIAAANYSAVLLAAGASRRYAAYQIVSSLIRTAFLLLGVVHFGVMGVALAPLFGVLLFYPISVQFIRPYGAWMPRYDAVFMTLSMAIGAGALYLNWDRLLEASTLFAGM